MLRVHDGDTVTLRCGDAEPVRVRLADIDAPELHQPYGPQAREALVLAIGGASVGVRSRAVDRYQRLVANIDRSGADVGLVLVADGLAWCGLRPSVACRSSMKAAREARRGLWVQPDPEPPWQWRRKHPRAD